MTRLDIPTAAARLGELIASAAAGEDVVIADAAGRPVARLVTVDAGRPAIVPAAGAENPRDKVFGMFAGHGSMSDDFQAPLSEAELKEWGL